MSPAVPPVWPPSAPDAAAAPAAPPPPPLLQVEDLCVSYHSAGQAVPVVRGVGFSLGREKLALVGESGSGKSTVGRALLRVLPRHAEVRARQLRFDGLDLLGLPEAQMAGLRGQRLSMVMQDPKFSLNPVMTVGQQVGESVARRAAAQRPAGALPAASGAQVRAEVLALLERVRIREPQRVLGQYPHQLSGGMGQRVMIAMMLAQKPQLLVADEPTSALDVSVRQDVLDLLDELVAEQGLALLFISHDLNLVRRFCDRVLVLYAGRVVESLRADALDQARHPYTQGLLQALPSLRQRRAQLPVLQRDPRWLEPAQP